MHPFRDAIALRATWHGADVPDTVHAHERLHVFLEFGAAVTDDDLRYIVDADPVVVEGTRDDIRVDGRDGDEHAIVGERIDDGKDVLVPKLEV